MDSYLTQPLLPITPRIEFALQSAGQLPVITTRMDFTTLGLKMPNGNAHATPVNDNKSDIEVDNSTSDIEMDDLPLYTLEYKRLSYRLRRVIIQYSRLSV